MTYGDSTRAIQAVDARPIDGGAIAGSTLTQDVALRRAVVESGLPLEDAVTAVTVTPALCSYLLVKPGSTARSAWNVRIISPDPMSSMRAKATWATTRRLRAR